MGKDQIGIHMQQMNLREWSTLTIDQRKAWLNQQTPRSLSALLVMLGEMLTNADDLDAELALLEEPSDHVINARNFTYNTLRDVETHVANELHNRMHKTTLIERTV